MATQPIFDDVPAWPTAPDLNPRAAIGGNKPPLEELIPAEFRAALLADRPDFLTRLDDLVAAAERARATDDDELGRCGNLVKGYRALLTHISETHKAVKEPYLVGGKLVDAEKNALTARVETAKRSVEAIGDAYQAKKDAEAKAERERIAAEQRRAAEESARAERAAREAEEAAKRAAAEATNAAEREAAAARAEEARQAAQQAMEAAALAPAAAARTEPVRSDEGATVSGKTEWQCEIEDYTKALRHVRSDPKVKEAIDAAIKRLVRAGQRELTGVRIWPVAKANYR